MTTQQGSNVAALPENFYRYYLTIYGEIQLIYFKAYLSTFGITKSRLERIQKNLTPTGMAPLDRRGKRQNRPKASERY
ncbi:hypothetical protein PoB_004565200 [Plakobranchus ocellatus]|uniref:DUF4817 domain-containing protein n=1 Tax=Plakobranchus ocellatus TaxID=259542 RepID=A0AAV4BIJ7_9GAST|nr:hypothetical protein PoB_004565200 [Plakobranchus ocellatus]